ncbi:Pyrophosphate--fructose 6-phosphate 1-phosphotransferase OS=Rhodanobacter lindaniclasticus OX=75310 GN=pfp PE=3 SV=1 [Rhodanobacter lindaniclasticus]
MSPSLRQAAPGKLLYAQSGGVTAVINATAAGVIDAARAQGITVYAARNGILGALREELIDTSKESATAITALRHTPGGAFGSCRYKLKSLETNRAEYARLIEVFRAHDIRWFLYNGGNDSADTALKISQLGKAMGYDIRCIGVPKTVDNDLAVTDCCPGFGSVAKYTAIATGGQPRRGLDGRDLDQGVHPGGDGSPRRLDRRGGRVGR